MKGRMTMKMKYVATGFATLAIGGLCSGALAQTSSSQATSVDLNESTQAEIDRALSAAPPDLAREEQRVHRRGQLAALRPLREAQ
jgi:cytochrome c-type biogenesis protein CcmE